MLVRRDADDERARANGTTCDWNKIPKIDTPTKTFEDLIVEDKGTKGNFLAIALALNTARAI